jgi:hypothetical protein
MLDLSQLTDRSLPIHEIVTLVFYIVTGVYTIFSGILIYHWREYATDAKVTTYTLITYFATTIPLILVMGIMTLIIT